MFSSAGKAVGAEYQLDVGDLIDEPVETLVRIEVEHAPRNDQHPLRIPDRARHKAGVEHQFVVVHSASPIGISAEHGVFARVAEPSGQAIDQGNPSGVVERAEGGIGGSQRHWYLL